MFLPETNINSQTSLRSLKNMVKDTSSIKQYISAVGRRSEAVARVRLYNPSGGKIQANGVDFKKGDILVNGKPVKEYFRFPAYDSRYNKFLVETNTLGNYVFTVKVAGGGLSGQIDAMILGMARALDKQDREKYHDVLRLNGYLTRDPRTRERRKVGMGGKARRKKQSPKR